MKILEAVAYESHWQLVVLWEMLAIVEPFEDRQGQHDLRTWCAYWTSFQYTNPQDTLAILCWMMR